jgi:hypothetical protein
VLTYVLAWKIRLFAIFIWKAYRAKNRWLGKTRKHEKGVFLSVHPNVIIYPSSGIFKYFISAHIWLGMRNQVLIIYILNGQWHRDENRQADKKWGNSWAKYMYPTSMSIGESKDPCSFQCTGSILPGGCGWRWGEEYVQKTHGFSIYQIKKMLRENGQDVICIWKGGVLAWGEHSRVFFYIWQDWPEGRQLKGGDNNLALCIYFSYLQKIRQFFFLLGILSTHIWNQAFIIFWMGAGTYMRKLGVGRVYNKETGGQGIFFPG